MNKNTKNIIAFSFLNGIGAGFIKKNLSFLKSNIESLELLASLTDKFDLYDYEFNISLADKIIEDSEKQKIKIVTVLDDDYPPQLLEIKDPPPVLYCKGNLELLDKAIAVIGTRKSTELGNKIAGKVGQYFSKNWAICNGLVDGIDKNLVFIDGKILPHVIGVLSGGLDYKHTCPKLTSELADLVLNNNGLLVSENEPNNKEDQFSGSKASRIQAGLSKALILIQSSIAGGSKYTIKAFSALERPIAVIDFKNNLEYLQGSMFDGNKLLIEKGNQGIMEMCDIKKLDNIHTTKIIRLENSTDYQLIENEINAGSKLFKAF